MVAAHDAPDEDFSRRGPGASRARDRSPDRRRLRPDDARDAARRRLATWRAAQERFHESTPLGVARAGRARTSGTPGAGCRHIRAFAATAVLTLAVGLGLSRSSSPSSTPTCCGRLRSAIPTASTRSLWRAQDDAGGSFRWRDYQELRRRTICSTTSIAETTRLCLVERASARGGLRLGQLLRRRSARASRLGRPLAGFDAGARRRPVAVLSRRRLGPHLRSRSGGARPPRSKSTARDCHRRHHARRVLGPGRHAARISGSR